MTIKANQGELMVGNFPIAFLAGSNANTWHYVQDVCSMLVDQHCRILSSAGDPVSPDAVPTEGTYDLVSIDGTYASASALLPLLVST